MPRRAIGWVLATASALAAPTIPAPAGGGEPSAAYREALRRTIEGRERRRSRATADARSGRIVPFPIPPALIIRQTPEAHDEVRDLLRLLRGR